MSDEPTIYVSITRKVNLGNFESSEVTIGLSKIPIDADEHLIDQMMGGAEIAYRKIRQDLRAKVAIIRREDVAPDPESAVASAAEPVETHPVFEPHALEPTYTSEPYIPGEDEVFSGYGAFGHRVESHLRRDDPAPITDRNADGNGGGQLRRLNAALSGKSLGEHLRHAACMSLLASMGVAHEGLTSLRQLSKFEAGILIEWLETAPDKSLSKLRDSAVAMTGQLGLAVGDVSL